MPVQDFSFTAIANSTIDGIVISENCPAANINNAIRALMSDVMQELVYQGDISASASMSLAGVGWRMSSVSGSASIIHVGTGRAGLVRILRWNSPSTLVGSANIITDGGGSLVCATNDTTTFTSFGGGAWRALHFPASGVPAVYNEAITSSATTTDFLLMKSAAGAAKLVAATETLASSGTFTPAIAFGGAAVGAAYTTQTGKYIKIGNLVFVTLNIVLSAKGSSTGAATVTGLPFAGTGGGSVGGTAIVRANSNLSSLTAGGAIIANLPASGTTISLVVQTTTASSSLTEANFNNTSDFSLSGFYLA